MTFNAYGRTIDADAPETYDAHVDAFDLELPWGGLTDRVGTALAHYEDGEHAAAQALLDDMNAIERKAFTEEIDRIAAKAVAEQVALETARRAAVKFTAAEGAARYYEDCRRYTGGIDYEARILAAQDATY